MEGKIRKNKWILKGTTRSTCTGNEMEGGGGGDFNCLARGGGDDSSHCPTVRY